MKASLVIFFFSTKRDMNTSSPQMPMMIPNAMHAHRQVLEALFSVIDLSVSVFMGASTIAVVVVVVFDRCKEEK